VSDLATAASLGLPDCDHLKMPDWATTRNLTADCRKQEKTDSRAETKMLPNKKLWKIVVKG